MVSLSGHDAARPVKVGPSIVDMMGAVVGASAIVAALLHRDRTGEGQAIELAMYDVATWLTASAWPGLAGNDVPYAVANRNRDGRWQDVFATRDGYVAIAAADARPREALARACGLADVRPAPDVSDEALRDAVARWCVAKDAADVAALCQAAGVAAAPVLDLVDVAMHPQFRSRGVFVDDLTRAGVSAPIFGSVLRMSETPGIAQGFAEPVGASTKAVLAELRARSRQSAASPPS
jgi:crotonobetainyl-CoA:carnitine CoA-transferase CaiB-like acyl-CoA transferase